MRREEQTHTLEVAGPRGDTEPTPQARHRALVPLGLSPTVWPGEGPHLQGLSLLLCELGGTSRPCLPHSDSGLRHAPWGGFVNL